MKFKFEIDKSNVKGHLGKMTMTALRPARRLASSRGGERAREQLLDAAGEVFAEKGYDRATSREICERAGMNAAAVNYHFGGIDALYVACLVSAHSHLITIEALSDIASSDLPPKDKLRAYLAPVVRWLADPGERSWEIRLLSREIVSPSPLRDVIIETEILPKVTMLRGIVGELIGAAPDDAVVGRSILTVVAPCLLMAVASRATLEMILPDLAEPASETAPLVAHYERFILAGLDAVARAHRSDRPA